ncbi:cation diffusion facilitator family transporter [Teladorsagia circumcincta]|uniref:Cation diffusion facilitator family transporter n=1 Tax=Teladorsagia circumcincta TaxID=45464 RepID=A0A2G9UZH7_TELCI|nr:cation diffusion facilitator family transporter [Teladorsagia circumcincta]
MAYEKRSGPPHGLHDARICFFTSPPPRGQRRIKAATSRACLVPTVSLQQYRLRNIVFCNTLGGRRIYSRTYLFTHRFDSRANKSYNIVLFWDLESNKHNTNNKAQQYATDCNEKRNFGTHSIHEDSFTVNASPPHGSKKEDNPAGVEQERLSRSKWHIKGAISFTTKAERRASLLSTQNEHKYYEHQRRLLELYEQDKQLFKSGKPRKPQAEDKGWILLRFSFALNIFSLIGTLIASYLSGSLSIMSTFVDSCMDLLCGAVMNSCLQLSEKADKFNYPRGRQRLESVGVLLSAALMAFANIGMAMQALDHIFDASRKPQMTTATLLIMWMQTMLKAILSYACYKQGTPSSVVIAMDLRNDVASRISAVIFAYIGDKYWRVADPIGAIVLSTMIAISWFRHAVESVPQLVGRRAEQEQLSRILRIAIDHDDRIRCLDHLMVYHTGTKAFVELHIVMDERLPLKITHDVCHPLEKKLQRLEFVERAFVHCDYACDGD